MAGTFALKPGMWASHIVPLSSNPLIYRVELLFAGLETRSGSFLTSVPPCISSFFLGCFCRCLLEAY